MSATFRHALRSGPGYTFLKLDGVIDEDNTLAALSHEVRGQTLVLDLSGVTRINSCGVRDWVNWLNRASAMSIQAVLIRCSPAIISQVNMVTNFSGDAVIHSFFAPYYNPDTDESSNVLLFTADLAGQTPVRAPTITAPGTDTELEFDDFEESYFAFITGSPTAGHLDATTLALVQSLTPEIASSAAASVASHALESLPQEPPPQAQYGSSAGHQVSEPPRYPPPTPHPSAPNAFRQPLADMPTPLSSAPAAPISAGHNPQEDVSETVQVPVGSWKQSPKLPTPLAAAEAGGGFVESSPGVYTPSPSAPSGVPGFPPPMSSSGGAPGFPPPSSAPPSAAGFPAPSASLPPPSAPSPYSHHGAPPPPAAQHPFGDAPPPPAQSGPFISSPREAAQAFHHQASAPGLYVDEKGGNTTTIVLIGLGITLIAVFGLLLWLAFG